MKQHTGHRSENMVEPYSLYPRGWEKKRHSCCAVAGHGQSQEVWPAEATGVRKEWGNETLCTYL